MMSNQAEQQNPPAQQQFVQVMPSAGGQKDDTSQQQCWYYYPQGTSGPVMIRIVKKDASGKNSFYTLRQNEEGNYQFDEKKIQFICATIAGGTVIFPFAVFPLTRLSCEVSYPKSAILNIRHNMCLITKTILLVIATDAVGTMINLL